MRCNSQTCVNVVAEVVPDHDQMAEVLPQQDLDGVDRARARRPSTRSTSPGRTAFCASSWADLRDRRDRWAAGDRNVLVDWPAAPAYVLGNERLSCACAGGRR